MKRIGMLGGMSAESSAVYYRLFNEAVRERLGGLHSADCVLLSVDFAEIEELQRADDWDAAGQKLAIDAKSLEAAGCELLVLCTNTMHKVAGAITDAIGIPMVHIADASADAIRAAGFTTVGLIATAYTMEQDFYVGRLREQHGLKVLVPDADDRRVIHDVIFKELCRGVISDGSRDAYKVVIGKLVEQGAEAILLGCTEIGLLIGAGDVDVPVFDTAVLQVRAAVDLALAAECPAGTT